ncbi:unnamed protein product [Enterobius vermicularis]|uniref:Uncharacterized protein n=1 Tax=Enterobius vermicularis TaxID=51028 RepID=A0A0N4VKI9_ENTVE|nr:unnamed protein product [Enterobius vermicularis]
MLFSFFSSQFFIISQFKYWSSLEFLSITAINCFFFIFFKTTVKNEVNHSDSYWSEWGGWSVCSVSCGGCGIRMRVRACYGISQQCSGPNIERQKCGFERCPLVPHIVECRGRIVLPCDLMNQLKFSFLDGSSIKYMSSIRGLTFPFAK